MNDLAYQFAQAQRDYMRLAEWANRFADKDMEYPETLEFGRSLVAEIRNVFEEVVREIADLSCQGMNQMPKLVDVPESSDEEDAMSNIEP